MKDDDLEISKEKIKDGIKLILKGRINSSSADVLRLELDEAIRDEQKNIILNLLRVDYLSSAGIRVILKIYKDAALIGARFGIEMPSANVKNVLGMTALDELLIK